MMKTKCYVMTVIFSILVVLSAPASAQVDILGGQDQRAELRIGAYADDADGNQNWAREYDGRTFDVWGIELIDSYGYDGQYQYWLETRDLILRDEDVDFSLAVRNDLGLKLSTSALTHRLSRIPEINPYLAPFGASLIGPTAPVGDAFVSLTPDADYRLNRRVNNLGLRLLPGGSRRVAFVADWWQELEDGASQVLFYNTSAAQGPTGRLGVGFRHDRSTDIGTLGADAQLGRNSVLNYRFRNIEFTERAGQPLVPGNLISNTRIPNIKVEENTFKARAKLGNRVHFTGVHTNRQRNNQTAIVPTAVTAYQNAGSPLDASVKIDSTNLSLTYLATDALSLTGRWRKYELDNRVPPVFRLVGGVPSETPENQGLSRDIESFEVDATFTGIRRALLRVGFEHRDSERETNPLHPPHEGLQEAEGFEHPFTSSTKSDIWRVGARYSPSLRLNLAGNYETSDTSAPAFQGSATDISKLNLNATYLMTNNFAVYGDFSRLDEQNRQTAAFRGINLADLEPADAATNPDYEEGRAAAAGLGSENKWTTTSIGAWYGLSPRLTLDANLARVDIDANALWVIGIDPAFLPHLPLDFVPYRAKNDQWSVGATYLLSPRTRLYGRFLNSDSEGRSLPDIIPGDPALPRGWTPVNFNEDRWTLGFAYDIAPRSRLLLDFSVSDFEDRIDSGNNGSFNLWRVAWSSRF